MKLGNFDKVFELWKEYNSLVAKIEAIDKILTTSSEDLVFSLRVFEENNKFSKIDYSLRVDFDAAKDIIHKLKKEHYERINEIYEELEEL